MELFLASPISAQKFSNKFMSLTATTQKISGAFLIFFIIASGIVLPIPSPKKAEADVSVLDWKGLIQWTITAAQNVIQTAKDALIAANTDSLVFKEYVLDWIASTAAKLMIKTLSQSLINWIKTGDFRGSLVIENFLDNFTREIDNKVGIFLEKYFGKNSRLLSLLCEPFRLTIPPLIQINRRSQDYEERARCKLSDIVRNVENFDIQIYYSDFSQGGWDAWFAMLSPANNFLGQYLMGVSELDRVKAAAFLGSDTEVKTTGGGLLSWQKCDEVPAVDPFDESGGGATGETYKTNCKTQTPGGLVQDMLNQSETSWIRQLEAADEINEVLNTFFQTMLQKLLSPNEGFTGRDVNSIPWDNSNPIVTPPSSRAVMITSPFDGLEVSGTTKIVATLTNPSPNSTVQFAVDGVNQGGVISANESGNFELDLDTSGLTNGERSVTAILLDASGNRIGESTPVRIRVNNP